jgi:Ca-activated chloride channel family protein
MPTLSRFSLALILAGGLSASALSQETSPRSDRHIVSLFATVTDARGRLVPNLTKEDFEVLDNGKLQPLAVFEHVVQPISVVVMLDTSGSMTQSIGPMRSAAEQFLIQLRPEDQARVGAFNDRIQISPRFTNKHDELVADMKNLGFGNGTRLWDAIATSLDAMRGIEGRRVVLLVSDGEDLSSKTAKLSTVIDRTHAEEVTIYAIRMQSSVPPRVRVVGIDDSGLRRVVAETGGGYFEVMSPTDFASTFARVTEELHSQYVVGFAPPILDGKVHKLTLKVKQGMRVRARRSYLAADKLP